MTHFNRRNFMQWLGAAGLLSSVGGSLTGCGDDSTAVNPVPVPSAKELGTLHFDLSHTNPESDHVLIVGARRYPLSRHTEETRGLHRERNPGLVAVPDHLLTHFAVAVPFPVNAAQSFRVEHQHPDTTRRPYLSVMGIRLPSSVTGSAASKLSAAKMKTLGLTPQDDSVADINDLADFVNMTDAALCIVCHHPELLSIDPEVLATVLGHISDTRSFQDLVVSLATQGRAQSIEGWDEGWEGWANGQIANDMDGNPVPDTKGGFRWVYVYTDATNAALRPVVQQALTAVRNDPTLDGKRYKTLTGMHAIDGSAGVQTRALGKSRSSLTANTPYQYKLSDEDWKSGRKIEIDSITNRTINMTVSHSYFRHMGVYVRFADVDGNLVALSDISADERPESTALDKKYAHFLGLMDPPQRLLGIPFELELSEEYSFTIPTGATSAEILCASLGIGSLPNSHAKYEDVEVVGSAVTGIFELALPAFFMAWGVGVDKMEAPGGKKVLAAFLKWLLENFVISAAVRGIFAASGVPSGDIFASWGMDMVMSLIRTSPAVVVDLLEWGAEVSAEEALEESLPVVGEIILAAEILGTLAEITETVVDIFCSPWVIPSSVTLSMDIGVTVSRDPADYQFPASAVKYKLIATFSDSTSRVIERTLDNTKVPTIAEVFSDVPSGGQVEVTATFYASNGWVAGHGTTGRVPNLLSGGSSSLQLAITIAENKIPLSAQTHYYHRQLLTVQNGAHQWIQTAVAPTETASALLCTAVGSALCSPSGITLNMNGRLGYHWQGASPGLKVCGGTTGSTQVYTMQGIGLDSTNPDDALRVLQCGFARPAHLVYSLLGALDGQHFAVAPTLDSSGSEVYHARKLSLAGKGPIDLTTLPSWGRFSFERIRQVILHPLGYLIALHMDLEKLELLRIPDAPYASDDVADYAKQIGGQGSNIGMLNGAVAIAPAHDGASFLVLEAGNQRIQAFNVNGVVVPYFANDATNAPIGMLSQDAGVAITYVDIALESQGYIYLLSYEGAGASASTYRLDIYEPDGTFQSRTRGVAAAKLVVDVWRAVYTLNYQLLQGPAQRPEPSVSEWVPSTPG